VAFIMQQAKADQESLGFGSILIEFSIPIINMN